MSTRSLPFPAATAWRLLALAGVISLAGCGGWDDEDAAQPAAPGGGGAPTITCNTAGYVAGAVQAPSAGQLAAYAGTYNGDEGRYGANPGDPFVKSGSAAFVLGADGSVSYKGVSYAATSICIDKAAGPFGTILYVVAGNGHIDVADKVDASLGSAWGISLADGTTIFTKGLKP